MAITTKRKEYIYQYAKENLKRIPLDVPKATYEKVKCHAEARSESVNGFIKRAIQETMDRDNGVPAASDGSAEGAADNGTGRSGDNE